MTRVLILGGTAEARALASALAGVAGVRPISSLAGRVADPALPAGEVRIGGFGGAAGLADWLAAESIAALVDATHPFAATISWSAARAAAAVGIPILALRRPGWIQRPGDDWRRQPSAEAAARALESLASEGPASQGPASQGLASQGLALEGPASQGLASEGPASQGLASQGLASEGPASQGLALEGPASQGLASEGRALQGPASEGPARRVFLTTGRTGLAPFACLDRHWFLIRSIDAPGPPLPPRHQLLLARGPFSVAEEIALMREHRIQVLVTKDSGGPLTEGKLVAARELGVPVLLIQRPPLPDVPTVQTVQAACDWITGLASGSTS